MNHDVLGTPQDSVEEFTPSHKLRKYLQSRLQLTHTDIQVCCRPYPVRSHKNRHERLNQY